MEEKERTTPTGDRSRGVSTFLSPGATQESSGLSYFSQTFPAAASAADDEVGDHVRIPSSSHSPSPLGHAGGVSAGSCEQRKDSMDDDYSGRRSGHVSVVATSRSTTPFFGQPEDIIDGTGGSVPAIGGGPSWRRRFELNFARPPPPPTLAERPVYFAPPTSLEAQWSPETYAQSVPAALGTIGSDITRPADGQRPNPDYTAAGPLSGAGTSLDSPSLSVPRRINYTKGHHISARAPPGMQETQEADGQVVDASRGVQFTPTHSLTSSSYPSTSPLLPPPPPTLDHRFDLGDIMFPGAGAVDGGVRVVPAGPIHNHSEGGSVDGHGELISAFDDSAAGWKRHTRVYGGGVCLACAAAGGGGFYGARVRPEDKR
ncbi:hypothetical protein VP1G_10096 [Cytospora mali]|uniref:Uncharacterized protein n=1 Tax=Cytospora mali TaxID=578113 RepID=A0A194VG44_CYTMA|nr:hypothetical protein VP1G_10096 [Valsa mali var. pyri (nom. inval.)]